MEPLVVDDDIGSSPVQHLEAAGQSGKGSPATVFVDCAGSSASTEKKAGHLMLHVCDTRQSRSCLAPASYRDSVGRTWPAPLSLLN